ncbi:MAG: biphenyl 2,3-dioxygenase [Sneathiella sp.]|uniref:VOC family protein n=1 Tax=Sneathiella sp. TaxID=1964365 RepID=UPI000C3E8757|nr:VOC family protein [Sneathiella sp.]MAZ01789.1 biphenyl 2,3-dioxygenase [Sneathiella sp.]
MGLKALGYVGIGSQDLSAWEQFGNNVIGFQCTERTPSFLAFRMDDHRQRIFIDKNSTDGTCFFGWEVDNAIELDCIASKLDDAGIKVVLEPAHIADARCVGGVISFSDPSGNRVEIFHKPQILSAPFIPGRNISGFRTGQLGLGHAVLTVNRIDDVLSFYTDVLGFKVSDFIAAPFRAYFLHVNSRHHSLALIETGVCGVHHVMVEMYSLDDVGQTYDLAIERESVSVTLGRHTNDFMTSFYTKTPAPFLIECGWGGREIDPESWSPQEIVDGPSLWGHDRKWLSTAERKHAREMALNTAERGIRQPVQVMPGNFEIMSDRCPWADTGNTLELLEAAPIQSMKNRK